MMRVMKNLEKPEFYRSGRKPASALLLSFFMMSLLILISIGVSFLVTKDIASVRTMVSGSQSQYAAEGMAELGLMGVNLNLPGYEPSYSGVELGANSLASLDTTARGDSVPCGGEDEGWRALAPNESIQLALFAQTDAAGSIEKIEEFYVEFYVGDENGGVTYQIQDDVLRWKVLGLEDVEVGNEYTEAISEYIPMNGVNFTREAPSIFGSDESVMGAVPDGYSRAKYYQRIGSGSSAYYVFQADYSIWSFLNGHDYNYLILTNIIQGSYAEDTIFFRLHTTDYSPVCEYITLSASGSTDFGDTQQSMDMIVREGENLPAFDFVLYHTDLEDDEEEGSGILVPAGIADLDIDSVVRGFER